MSISLYYQAKREQPLTLKETSTCREIIKQYDTQYPFGELYEGFCVYDLDSFRNKSEKDVIFSGATKLPTVEQGDIQTLFDIIGYWVKCLNEITKALPGAVWEVNLDDMEMIWDYNEGWRFPTDEEYKSGDQD